MAAFRILCRITEVSPHRFEARVFAVPVADLPMGLAARSECRIFADAQTAAAECLRMAEAMRKRLDAAPNAP